MTSHIHRPTTHHAAHDAIIHIETHTTLFLTIAAAMLHMRGVHSTQIRGNVGLLRAALSAMVIGVDPNRTHHDTPTNGTNTGFKASGATTRGNARILIVERPFKFRVLSPIAIEGSGLVRLYHIRGKRIGDDNALQGVNGRMRANLRLITRNESSS